MIGPTSVFLLVKIQKEPNSHRKDNLIVKQNSKVLQEQYYIMIIKGLQGSENIEITF